MSGLEVLNFKLNKDVSNEQNIAAKNTEIHTCYLIFQIETDQHQNN